MVQLKSGNVNIGDSVLYSSGGKRFLGKFESLYDNRMNVRLVSDNSLHTVSFKEVDKAGEEVIKSYFESKDKAELINQLKVLTDLLKPHGVKVYFEENK